MIEKQKDKNVEETGTVENTAEGSEREATTLLEQANAAAKRLEEANIKAADNLRRQEAIRAREALGGNTDAGQPSKVEETPQEYAKKVMSGELND